MTVIDLMPEPRAAALAVNVVSGPVRTVEVVIADGETVSEAVAMPGLYAWQVYVPAGFDGTALTFQGSVDGVTYADAYDNGTQVAKTVGAGHMERMPIELWGVPYLRFVAGTAQTGDVTLTVVVN